MMYPTELSMIVIDRNVSILRFLYNPMAVENIIALHIEMNVISTLKPENFIWNIIYG